MRLAHLADPHLGFRQFSRLSARGLNQRETDVALAFTRAIDGIIAERPDVVIVAGDVFHLVRPTNSAILTAVRQFTRLRRALPAAPVVVIAGNHDTPRSTDTVSIFGVLHELGINTVTDKPERLTFPELDLSILAVPHQALFADQRPALERAGPERYQVKVLHGEVPGLFGEDRGIAEPGGAMLTPDDLGGDWNYVALGHYHVQHKVRDGVWYAGALDYTSTNPWAELAEQRLKKLAGKGWLLVDLDRGVVESRPIDPPRRFIELPWLDANGREANEIDGMLAAAVAKVAGGIKDAVVRQVVQNVPRAVGRALNHGLIRDWKNEALHFQLDLRRPEMKRIVGMGAPGRAQTLRETVQEFLTHRPLPAGIERKQFIDRGLELIRSSDPAEDG